MMMNATSHETLQAEVLALRQQVAEQARLLAERQQILDGVMIYEAVVKHMHFGLMVLQLERPGDPTSFRVIGANAAAHPFLGFDLEAEVGRLAIDVFPGALESGLPQLYAELVQSGQRRSLGEMPYHDGRVAEGFFTIEAIPLPHKRLCVVFENITERKRAETVLRQSALQEEKIQAQAAVLAELSTPLIPLNNQVMVMPLIGAVDSRRAQQVLETLLQGIASSGAQIAILDITGVPVVDTQVANALIHAAQAVKLLGAQVVLTGIRPEVAQTLVGLGADLGSIITRGSLQSGIAYAITQS
jgi:rsbT co-antagonist protein RsbR